MKKLRVQIWSDIACPWCHIGKRRFERALEQFAERAEVEVLWRSFELDPASPRELDASVPFAERLAKKYAFSRQEGEAMMRRVADVAAGDGLDFQLDRLRPGNTFDAHRVLHLAHERGKQDAAKERFLRGYLSEGASIGDPETIVRLAGDAGLDTEEVRALLASDAYADAVRADEQQAAELGIRGVPFFVLGERYAVSGAQPAEVFLGALRQAYAELASARPLILGGEDDAACGPDGCAVPGG